MANSNSFRISMTRFYSRIGCLGRILRPKRLLLFLFIFIIVIIFGLFWITRQQITYVQLQLQGFGSIHMQMEPKDPLDKKVDKPLDMTSGIPVRVHSVGRLFEFIRGIEISGCPFWPFEYSLSVENSVVTIFDVSGNTPVAKYDPTTRNYYLSVPKFGSLNESISPFSPKALRTKFRKLIYESRISQEIVIQPIPPLKNFEDKNGLYIKGNIFEDVRAKDGPSLQVLYPHPVVYIYGWEKNSGISVSTTSTNRKLGDGLRFEQYYTRQPFGERINSWDALKKADGKLIILSGPGFTGTGHAIMILKNMKIRTRDFEMSDSGKTFLVQIAQGGIHTFTTISMTGMEVNWRAYNGVEPIELSFNPLNHSMHIENPRGSFFIGKETHKFGDLGELDLNFYDFPKMEARNAASVGSQENANAYYIHGRAKSFKYREEEFVPRRWSRIPTDVRGVFVGFAVGFLTFVVTRLIEVHYSSRVQKIEVVKKGVDKVKNTRSNEDV